MSVTDMFKEFLSNLKIDNAEQISNRYGEITRCLNKKYRDSESKINNTLQVGSYGRKTAIKGISDLDMVYMLPLSVWEGFKNGRQSALLQDVKEAVKERYSRTGSWGDGQVVVVSFENQEIEIVPSFEQDDGTFKYPDTNNGGSWEITNPRAEIKAMSDLDSDKNTNLRPLCKMIRAWKNKHGIVMGGFLIDTLAYNFLNSTDSFDDKSFPYYDWLVRDFFKYISELPDQNYYLAPGSRQYVYIKKKFQKKAKKAYELILDAIDSEKNKNVNSKWKKVFGSQFPSAKVEVTKALHEGITWDDTEQFIEDYYPIDIRYQIDIDCDVTQNGFREHSLLEMLRKRIPLLNNRQLIFKIIYNEVPRPFEIKWKVLNKGEVAKKKNVIRGQIVSGEEKKHEPATFRGAHEVECYIVKNGVVVARAQLDVPITQGE
ncbi:MAG: nucleotidyltransferase [Candidatus Delongbacteria bacterium]|jgi:hypothetical protein|nr:nucleotidyltransferase [Candidatus Delongbacteria bacterium]